MTAAELKNRTVRDLASMAKRKKVPGWHSMRKAELVKAILRQARAEKRRSGRKNGHRKPAPANGRTLRQTTLAQSRSSEAKDLTFQSLVDGNGEVKDRLIVMVRDSYWLHAYWELSRKSVDRAKVALGHHWHGARPVFARMRGAARWCDNLLSPVGPRHRNSRWREQLVHRRAAPAKALPT